ncbi:GGDEF domain-containing protein [Massilia sp. TS11]|uniref:sensor domain-containing diguanylate cyclase n=1 Tax=Massilia sp. TS11 TaxID=2908003 RepID=UPI001EDAA09F|nr:GGDEF domain-containing protein [Massilia sp. TS11]MCG2582924.1 GGDEF domain-containing protein [Massilia sp. TS11]
MLEKAERLDLLESVLRAMHLGAIVLDQQRRIVLWNAWMARHAGRPEEDVCGRSLFAVFPDLLGKRIDQAITQALDDGFPSVLSQTLHKAPFPLFADMAACLAEERMQQAVSVSPLKMPNGQRHCLIQINDVTVAVNREKLLRVQALELRSQTFSDGLTGIANRRHFDVAMEKEVRRAKRVNAPMSLMMIDIDYFKAYNDHYGHQQGDACLVAVASTLAAMLQRSTDLIARYGGEEFVVILPEMDAPQAARLAEAMRKRIEELNLPHAQSGVADRVTVSIGLATQSFTNPLDEATLLGRADKALYQAKRDGRNRVVN